MEEQTEGKGVGKIYNFCAYFRLYVCTVFILYSHKYWTR